MSVAQNSHLTNKPEADGMLILPTHLPLSPLALPYSISAPFYGYFKLRKAIWKGQKSKEGFVVTPGN